MVISSKSYLRQYGFFGLVASSFVIYGRFFVPLVAVVAIIELPPFLLADLLTHLFPGHTSVVSLSVVLQLGASFFGLFAIIAAISDVCLGNEISITRTLQRITARSVFQLFGTLLLSVFIPSLLCLALILGGVLLVSTDKSWSSIPGAITIGLGVLIYPYLLVRYIFAEQVVILEKKYWFQALRRSAEVVRKSWWRIAIFWLLYGLIVWLPIYLVMSGPRFIAVLWFKLKPPIVLDLYESFGAVIVTPLTAAFGTLFYYSERIRKHDLTTRELLEIKTFEAV